MLKLCLKFFVNLFWLFSFTNKPINMHKVRLVSLWALAQTNKSTFFLETPSVQHVKIFSIMMLLQAHTVQFPVDTRVQGVRESNTVVLSSREQRPKATQFRIKGFI